MLHRSEDPASPCAQVAMVTTASLDAVLFGPRGLVDSQQTTAASKSNERAELVVTGSLSRRDAYVCKALSR